MFIYLVQSLKPLVGQYLDKKTYGLMGEDLNSFEDVAKHLHGTVKRIDGKGAIVEVAFTGPVAEKGHLGPKEKSVRYRLKVSRVEVTIVPPLLTS